jgi:protein-L-isoaspartate(D-aspartate) O-methyltransferase
MWRRLVVASAVTLVVGACRDDKPAAPAEPAVARLRDDLAEERERMVDQTIVGRGIKDAKVIEVMKLVPREEFMPPDSADKAYEDSPQQIGFGLTISQPYIVATMTEAAHITPGGKVLEIGTGSGYQAAILAELGAHVYTIELNEDLAKRTRAVLDGLGYQDIQMKIGDGYDGWAEAGPFDAILVTCAPPVVPWPLVDQLAVGGRMVAPIGTYSQELEVVKRGSDGIDTEYLMEVNFGKMLGKAQRGYDDNDAYP